MSENENAVSWDSLLASQQEFVNTADTFVDWKPPAGVSLVCLPTTAKQGQADRIKGDPNSGKSVWWRVGLKVLQGTDPTTGADLTDNEFSVFYSTRNETSCSLLVKFATQLNSGQITKDMETIDSLIMGCEGSYYFQMETKQSGKYVNCNVVSCTPLEGAAISEEAPEIPTGPVE